MSASHRLQKICELRVKSLELNAQVDKNLNLSYELQMFVCLFVFPLNKVERSYKKQTPQQTPENTKSLRMTFSKNTSLGSCYSCFSFLNNLTEKYDVEV